MFPAIANGYSAPKGINSVNEIKQVQRRLGVTVDGVWGKNTQAAWEAMRSGGSRSRFSAPQGIDNENEIKQIQKRLGIAQSGKWDTNTNDTWEAMRSGGTIPTSKYTVNGFSAPVGVDSPTDVRNIQKVLGIKQSGIWDAVTQSTWNNQFGDLWTPTSKSKFEPPEGIENKDEIKQVQSYLGVAVDGIWGKETQNAWERMRYANTAATFTKTIIDKGKADDAEANQNALARFRQKNAEKNRQNLDWQIKNRPTVKKAEVFLQSSLFEQRVDADNKGIEAMTNLYDLFIRQGNNKMQEIF